MFFKKNIYFEIFYKINYVEERNKKLTYKILPIKNLK